MKNNLIGLGGAGINNLKRYLESGYFKDNFQIIGLDTSDANLFEDERVTFERVPDTFGSGSDQSANSDKYPEFLNRIISQYKIEDTTILVYSASGGTGSSMGPQLHDALASRGIPCISIVIGDMDDINRGSNTVRTLLNLNDITEHEVPVIYGYYQNGDAPQGKINGDITSFIDTFNVALNPENQRIDKMDIHNFFFYNKVVKATPVLSRLEFISDDNTSGYKRNPIACISLFDNEDNIKSVFPGLLYSKEGIFRKELQNSLYSSLHSVLDHGDSLKGLTEMLEDQRVINAETNNRFQANSSKISEKVDRKGKSGFVKYDI